MTMTAPRYTEEGTSKYVQTAQWKIHYNEAGEGHPIIFIHGGGPGATGWSNFGPNIQVLAGKYRCLAVDMPGYGGSDPVAPHAPNNALALKLFMDALGIEKAAFVGNSMGGGATLTFAVEYNDRISHIVTMGHAPVGNIAFSWPGGPGFGPTTEGLKVLAETRREPTVENFRKLLSVMVFDDSFVTEELLEQRVKAAHAHPETIGPNAVNLPQPASNGPSVLHRLMDIQTPALIIHGRDDRAVPIETSLQTLTVLKNSRAVIFNRCGHWAQLEHADEFNKQVDIFLSSN
jgi:2-hydroxy-6-oxonona-2,4-dienedioate hydrolase